MMFENKQRKRNALPLFEVYVIDGLQFVCEQCTYFGRG